MRYALIDNGVVANIIWLSSSNAGDFPLAVPFGDRPVAVGDTYDGTAFYRNGEKVTTEAERAAETAVAELAEAQAAYEEGVQEA